MTDSLQITYYGKGFSKGKNGTQKPLSGVIIGRGSPKKATLSALTALDSMNMHPVEDWLLDWCVEREMVKFKTLTWKQAIANIKKKL